MSLLNFLFKLLIDFVGEDSEDLPTMKSQGKDWWTSIDAREENKANFGIREHIKYWCSQWYIMLFFAIFYLFAKKWIYEYLNKPANYEKEPEEVEENHTV